MIMRKKSPTIVRGLGLFRSAIVLAALTIGAASFTTADEPPATTGASQSSPKKRVVAIGEVVDELKFKDIRYVTRSLRELGDFQAYVLVFTNSTCPIVQKYWPKLKRLDAEYGPKGVAFVSINESSDDEIATIARQAIELGIEFPCVKDLDGRCAQAVGADRSPHVVILDRQRRLRYRGRIDDQVRIGGTRPAPSRDDLKLALDDVLADRVVEVPETPVDGCLITFPTADRRPSSSSTFYEQVMPIMQRHCQECHRASGPAPFALETYEQAAALAAMIGEVVADRRMPPWYAHRDQEFANQRGLSAAERSQVLDWIRNGLPKGDSAKAPPSPKFSTAKWEIGEPDLITTALESHTLPEDGFVNYKYVVLPHIFWQDTWVSAVEILPSNSRIVHHCNLAYWKVGESFNEGNFITGRVPGGTAMWLDDGVGFKIPKGSIIGLQIHYTTTGKVETNRMSVGLKFPRSPIHKQLHHEQITTSRFAIPPGARAHPVVASRTLRTPATGIGMFSHMHLRGKDMTFVAHLPNGETETLLSIPNYHYGWQQNYRWQPGTKKFPAGTRIEVTAHYDNSAFNPFNPDPTTTVRVGPQTIHEMMFGFFFYTDDAEHLNLRIDPKNGYVVREPSPSTTDAPSPSSAPPK